MPKALYVANVQAKQYLCTWNANRLEELHFRSPAAITSACIKTVDLVTHSNLAMMVNQATVS